MFGIGFLELIVIFIVALLVFGPDKLPELARMLGKFAAEVKRNTDSVRKEFYNSVYTPVDSMKTPFQDIAQDLRSVKNEILSPPPPPTSQLPQPSNLTSEKQKDGE